jgi:hypothetical protein
MRDLVLRAKMSPNLSGPHQKGDDLHHLFDKEAR